MTSLVADDTYHEIRDDVAEKATTEHKKYVLSEADKIGRQANRQLQTLQMEELIQFYRIEGWLESLHRITKCAYKNVWAILKVRRDKEDIINLENSIDQIDKQIGTKKLFE